MVKCWVFVLAVLIGVGCGVGFNSPRPPFCNYLSSPFGGGRGTLSDPYTICTVSHLIQVQNYLTSSFKQYADLDLAGNTTFAPIGSVTSPFTGSYNGNWKKISNWTYTSTENNLGLFSVVSGSAALSNINLVNFNLQGSQNIGLLVGSTSLDSQSIQISGCSVSGQVSALSNQSGGLIGFFALGTLTQSSSSASVTCLSDCGGLIGKLRVSGTVSQSFATGNVTTTRTTGANYAGGLIGSLTESGTILNCHATGKVTSTGVGGRMGGLIGNVWNVVVAGKQNSVQISDSYATGETSGGARVGGLIGEFAIGSISRSYATGFVSGQSSVGGLVGYSIFSTSREIANSYATGDVSVTNTGNVQAGGLVGSAGAITISQSYAKGAVSSSVASSQIGGLVGSAQSSTQISDSYATGSVSSGGSSVGGLVGVSSSGSTITNSYSIGTVSGSSNVGGLLGLCSSCGATSSSYWNTDIYPSSASGSGSSTSQMQNEANFSGWDFTSIWNAPSSGVYPTLR